MAIATVATVLLSGGIDSSACAHHLLKQGCAVDAIIVNYGQAAAEAELEAARHVARHLSISLREVRFLGSEPLGIGELAGRNAWLASTAYFATQGRSSIIGIGVHAGTAYYDCSSGFWRAMGDLVSAQSDGKTRLVTPFIDWSKKDIFDYFVGESGIPLEVTYSCEMGTIKPCGVCLSCKDREALGC